MYAAQLAYHSVEFKIDYTYTEKYPDPNVVTVPWAFNLSTVAPLLSEEKDAFVCHVIPKTPNVDGTKVRGH